MKRKNQFGSRASLLVNLQEEAKWEIPSLFLEKGSPLFSDFFCIFWQPLLAHSTILVSSASSWVIHGPTLTSAWNLNLLIDCWHQSWPHNSLVMLWDRQKLFPSLSAGSENPMFQCGFHTAFSVIFSFEAWSSIQRNWFCSSLSRQEKAEMLQNSSVTPKKGAVHTDYFFPIWACDLPAKGSTSISFASSWETAKWNLPQAFASLQPLINLINHLLLHILPTKKRSCFNYSLPWLWELQE